MYSYEEIAVGVEEAHKRNRQVAAHVRGNDGVKLCVEAGVDVLEHATYADDEAIEMIAERKDDIFVVPGLGYHWGILVNGPACGIPQEHLAATEYQDEWEQGCVGDGQAARGRRARRAGRRLRLRLVPARPVREGHRAVRHRHGLLADGGDRRGDEARLASCCASSTRCGTIEEGKCADMLVVDGDPLADIAILQDRSQAGDGDDGRQGHGEHARPAAGAARTSRTS